MREWWNDQAKTNAKPYDDLLRKLGAGSAAWNKVVAVDKGFLRAVAESPAKLSYAKDGPGKVRGWVGKLFAARGESLRTAPGICIRRGPYVIANVFDESPLPNAAMTLEGQYVDLFDPSLAVETDKVLGPNARAFLYDLGAIEARSHGPRVLAASARVRAGDVTEHSYTVTARGPKGTVAKLRVYLPAPIRGVSADPPVEVTHRWDAPSDTALITLPNIAEDVRVTLVY